MKRTRHRFLVWSLLALFMLSLFPAGALAAEQPAISLEQAIRTVKDNFDIPKEYTNFQSGFNNYDNRQMWNLNWTASGEPGGEFHAQVDAETGEVVNMNVWENKYQPEPGLRLPAISKAQAQDIAAKMLNQLAPARVPELKPVADDGQVISLNNYGPTTYSFIWQREVNGAVFPGNTVTIGVRGDDGKVISYNLNWTKADLPATGGAISPDKAKEVFANAKMLELQYFLAGSSRPLAAGEKAKVILVYQLHHPSNGVIDALTGEPITLEDGRWFGNVGYGEGGRGSYDMMAQKSAAAAPSLTPLSPEELKEIEKAAKLISQDEAIAAVKKWVNIPDNLVLRSTGLMADWQSPDTRVWNLNWNTEKQDKGLYEYLGARVNAQTGELLGFDRSRPYPGQDVAGSIDRAGAQQVAENFLKKVQPDKFKEFKLNENSAYWGPRPLIAGQNPATQQFNYQRVVNGIVFPGNSINVTVDTVNKEVTNYNLEYANLDFPAPDNILSAQAANEAYFTSRSLTLSYNQVYGSAGPEAVRLVYQPISTPGKQVSNIIDAKTGESLDWQGKPLSRLPQAYRFTDIQGNFGETEISLLGQAGIFGEYGDTFRPAENVTLISILRAMLSASNGPWSTVDLTDEQVIKQAKDRNWLKEDLPANSTVNREVMAKLLVRLLNLDRAARVQGIYQIPCTDTAAISQDSMGYVALAWGLNIMKGDGQTFGPDQSVSRAEAAVALVRALKTMP